MRRRKSPGSSQKVLCDLLLPHWLFPYLSTSYYFGTLHDFILLTASNCNIQINGNSNTL
uniref:Uncharacterized protein n=1 Tax=Rhizophora mucronata TaxID=61149 RepID=A0A2P2M2J5_RHIMU